MRPILAIVWLTWKAAWRFRLLWVLAVLLVFAVGVLPMIVRSDGTGKGLVQIVLTYTMSMVMAILGTFTLWLSCGTLAKDIEECQIQMVCVKPIARSQVWIGKWLGVMSLNLLLLGAASVIVYGTVMYRAARLPEGQKQILNRQVLVGRGSAKPDITAIQKLIEEDMEKNMKIAISQGKIDASMDPQSLSRVADSLREELKARREILPPGVRAQEWTVKVPGAKGFKRGHVVVLRVKFQTPSPVDSNVYRTGWELGPGAAQERDGWNEKDTMLQPFEVMLTPNTYHEIPVAVEAFAGGEVLKVRMYNLPGNPSIFRLPIEDSLEVLYRESSFAMNFARGMALLFCWIGVLAAMGLAAASFMSFSMAAFACMGLLIASFSTPLLKEVVKDSTIMQSHSHEGKRNTSLLDKFAIPSFQLLLTVMEPIKDYSPIESLSAGRSITWGQLSKAYFFVWGVCGGVMACFGMIVFHFKELALPG